VYLGRREFLAALAAGGIASTVSAEPRPAGPQSPPGGAPPSGDPWLEIHAENLVWNLQQIRARAAGKRVMAVIKANGYGHGLVEVARVLAGAGVGDFLVGKLEEARALRAAGISGRILNFGPFADADAERIVRLGVSQNVYTDQVAALDRAAQRLGRRARVQVKVDTGLGRVGVPHGLALEFMARVAAMPGIEMEGVFTTFTEDAGFDAAQLARFKDIGAQAAQRGLKIGVRHAASSAAIVDFPPGYTELDMVRPGIMLYGLYPSEQSEKDRKLDLRPVMSLKTRIAYVKTLEAGESAGYHRAFVATQPERVATLPVGYSDGLPRALAGKGHALVGGRRCPIVVISANAAIVRLGDAPAAIGDEAVLIGSQAGESITASEVARLAGTSVYAVAMGMSATLPRVLV
jgi:alanine racemase